MTIADVARATRKYFVESGLETGVQTCFIIETESGRIFSGPILYSYAEAQAACDLLNLLAVLEAIREPSEGVVEAALNYLASTAEGSMSSLWRAMIDKLIAEVSNDQR